MSKMKTSLMRLTVEPPQHRTLCRMLGTEATHPDGVANHALQSVVIS